MPEGPEIRRAADRLQRAIVDQPLRGVWFAFEALKRHEALLARSRVRAIETRAKALLTHFDCGLSVYNHNQLYGRWYTCKPDQPPATTRTLRFAVYGERADILLYSASDIEVLDAAGLAEHRFLKRLGPDLLHPQTTLERVLAHIQHPARARRRLADLLLDQGFLAGIGNYLRSEILHDAALLPTRKLGTLGPAEQQALAASALRITQRAYALAGVTNDPNRAAQLKAAGLGYAARRHAVFHRAGQPCYRCGSSILSATANRRMDWCPGCQF